MLTSHSASGPGRHRCRRRCAGERRSDRLVDVAAAVLIVSALVTAGVTGWDWLWRVHEIRTSQAALARDWTAAPPRLHLPSLGLNLVVVEGDRDADLLRGPGHMPDAPAFGAPGNTGVAGHRYLGAFWDLDRVRVGDRSRSRPGTRGWCTGSLGGYARDAQDGRGRRGAVPHHQTVYSRVVP